jgi:hypothetical protein
MPPGVHTHEVTVVMLGVIGIEQAQELLLATFLVYVLANIAWSNSWYASLDSQSS